MAQWDAKSIHEVVQAINDENIVLPVIQRNLVWDEDKMELLFDSLMKGNSFGGIMALEDEKGSEPLFAFRRFSREGELQDSDLPSILSKTTQLIIDGQQRLQTFYMGLLGSANGKALYFNLFSDGDYEFKFASQASELPRARLEDGNELPTLWYPVRELYQRLKKVHDDTKVAKEIARDAGELDGSQKELVTHNVVKFYRAIFVINALGLSSVNIDKDNLEMERRRMVELFRRLNDGGTRLTAVDLVASRLKGFDYRLEAFLRHDIANFADIGFGQDEVVKLLFLLQDNYTREVTEINKEDAEFVIANTERILKTLAVTRQLLKDAELYQYYRDGGRSVIPLYFVAYHIFHKAVGTDGLEKLYVNYDANNPEFTNLKRWLYLSLLNGVFSRGKGWTPYRTGIRKILAIVSQSKNQLFPAEAIFAMYEAHPLVFSRELSSRRLAQWDMSFVFYLIYGCRSLSGRDVDHIQPKSLLEAALAPAEKIHSVSNFQLLDEDTNRAGKRAKELKEWIKDWEETERNQYLTRHLIPQRSELWSLENFEDFLNVRSGIIVEKIQSSIPIQSIQSQSAVQASPQQKTSKKRDQGFTGAAMLKNSERDPETWLCGVADKEGNGEEFRQIVAAARSVGLYARFQNAWWIVMFTPPKKRNLGLIELGTSLSLWVNLEGVAQYLGCSAELAREKLGYRQKLQSSEVANWVENLKNLFANSQIENQTRGDTSLSSEDSTSSRNEPPSVLEFDRQALILGLPVELQNHPILSDKMTWDDYWIKNGYGGPIWSRRISRELDLNGIYTVGDMALLVMVLGLRVSHKESWGNFYIFNKSLPSGKKPHLRIKNFGPWSWKMTLQRLKAAGFDWQEFVAK